VIKNVIGVSPTCAPAGVLGLGSADACRYPAVGAAVRPDLDRRRAAVQGTGVPIGMVVAGTAITSTAIGTASAGTALGAAALFPRTAGTQHFAQNDGTTLGIHSSRRPQS